MDGTYFFLAGLHIPLIAMLVTVIDAPAGRKAIIDGGSIRNPLAAFLRRAEFWRIVLSSGLIAGGAIAKATQLLPLMVERGLGVQQGR